MDGIDGETRGDRPQISWRCSWRVLGSLHSHSFALFGRSGTDGKSPALCVADKLAFVLTPAWLYLPMARATGELAEYMLRAKERQAGSEHFTVVESAQLNSQMHKKWLTGLKSYTRRWIEDIRRRGGPLDCDSGRHIASACYARRL